MRLVPAAVMRPAVLVVGLAAALAGCDREATGVHTGYVEGEYVRVAAPVAGRLVELHVQRGATIAAGAALFALERDLEHASVAEADESIAVIRAQAEQAQAQWRLAEANLKRVRELRAKGLASEEQVDEARTEHLRSDARRRELVAQQRSAEARREQARWQLTHKVVEAPAAGLVDDTLYRVGEWVPAGAPVVSLLPPENRLIRFFVPQAVVGTLRRGAAVTVQCDGCARSVGATISFISPAAEFTPPVIYSQEAREKLVFLVEARPAAVDAAGLHPGQPVDVQLVP